MKTLQFIFVVSLLFSLNLSNNVCAQTDTTKLLPAVEISSFRPNLFSVGQLKVEADPSTVKQLEHQGLQDFLQIATPLSFRTYGTGISSISARGTGASHTALLWNGINVQNSLSGIIDLPLFEMGSGDKVSVKYGASTALFGSGAIGSTIFFDNEKPNEQGVKGKINAGVGSFDFQQYSANLRYRSGKFAGETRISTQLAENDFSFRNTTELGAPVRKAVNAAYWRRNLTQHLFFEIKKNQFLKVHFWHSQNQRSLMPSLTSANDNAILKDTSSRVVTEWTGFLGKYIMKVRSAFSQDNNLYASNTIAASRNKLNTFVNEAELNRDFGKNMHSRLALNYTSEHSLSSNFLEKFKRNRLAILLNQVVVVPQLASFSLNLRQEFYSGRSSPFTFNAGADRKISKGWRFRASVSRVYNLPALNDLYWKDLGNPDLKPEKGWSGEAGVSGVLKEQKNQQLDFHFTFYWIFLNNRILWQPSNGIWIPGNLNTMRSNGIEVMSNFKQNINKWALKGSVQYQLASARGDEGRQLIYIPVHNGSLSFTAVYKQFSIFYQQAASSRRYMSIDHSTWTYGFTTSNVGISYLLKLNRTSTMMTLRALNVFNTSYQVIQYFPNPGRNIKIDLTFNF